MTDAFLTLLQQSVGATPDPTDPASSTPSPLPLIGEVISAPPQTSGGPVGSTTEIYQKILKPTLVNLPYLDSIVKQAAVLTAAIGGTSYGTLTAARPAPKPFIVGFITPDVPINYIPVSQTKSQLAVINSQSANSKPGPSGVSSNVPYSPPGAPGLQPKVQTTFSSDDLKSEIISNYTSRFGQPPTDATVSLMYAQFALESGFSASSQTVSCSNYNLGNYHAGGGIVTLDGKPTPGQPLPAPANLPQGGSYFLTYDNFGPSGPNANQYYSVYMQNFDSLHGAVSRQLGQLVTNWPGTATAQTPEDFNQALINPAPGHGLYYTADPSIYLRGLQTQQQAYLAGGGSTGTAPNIIGQPTTSVTAATNSTPSTISGPPNGSVMDNGDVTGADEDPMQSTLGRNIAPSSDSKRNTLTNAYLNSIIHDLNVIKAMPPLLMLINPESFERSYEHSSDTGTKGRAGQIVQVWLEKPMTISCKGVSAGQYTLSSDGSGGLSQINRIQSVSYENLLSLVLTYKNNGTLFDGYSQSSLGVPVLAMSLFIYYDNHIYIGSFSDFVVDDEAEKPYNMSYNWKFNVRYDLSVEVGSITDSNIGTFA